jgi:CDP-diacylglycerol--glycerol-3-phosphate 3-phosphatidyltransferase
MAQMHTAMMPQAASRKANIPNLLTLARVVLAFVFVGVLSAAQPRTISAPDAALADRVGELTQGSTTLLLVAAGIFVIAAITDALDGHLARTWNVESKFGRIMDPFADKILVLGGFVLLAGPAFSSALPSGSWVQISGVSEWMVVVLIARELLVTSIRGVYEGEGVDFSAGSLGKLKMVLQSVCVPAVLLLVAFTSPVPGSSERTIVVLLVWATVVVTLLSAFPYIGRAMKHTVDQQARMLEVMRGKKPRKPTKNAMPGAKPRKKSTKGGQGAKRR